VGTPYKFANPVDPQLERRLVVFTTNPYPWITNPGFKTYRFKYNPAPLHRVCNRVSYGEMIACEAGRRTLNSVDP
jgi:hypothetical protein